MSRGDEHGMDYEVGWTYDREGLLPTVLPRLVCEDFPYHNVVGAQGSTESCNSEIYFTIYLLMHFEGYFSELRSSTYADIGFAFILIHLNMLI